MTLSPEQQQAVAAWVAAGDNLSVVQKKLAEEFKISMTYMDIRFLVDDLGLELKNATARGDVDADLSKAAPATGAEKKAGLLQRLKKAVGAGDEEPEDALDAEAPDEEAGGLPDELPPGIPGAVKVELDRVMRPGAVASGNVTFSDGVSGKWALDQLGRLMLDLGRKGYQPSAADVQSFQQELSRLLQGPAF